MQRVCQCPGGIKAYLESPQCLLDDDTRKCPWCPSKHALRRHGYYSRYAIAAGTMQPSSISISVVRLLCVVERKTVSLLPDFCLPYRQHGPDILGIFLTAFCRGATLVAALRRARPDAPSHSVAQSLRDGFLRREVLLKAYIAGLRLRALDPPVGVPPPRRRIATLVYGLLESSADVERTFRHHARAFHSRFTLGLA